MQLDKTLPVQRTERTSPGLLGHVSIVVPVGPGDACWRLLMHDLSPIGTRAELLLVGVDPEPSDFAPLVAGRGPRCAVRWLAAPRGRAHQMNLGAAHSTRPFLWFLHADSRLDPAALAALDWSLAAYPDALHFFDLEFQDDGPRTTCWNTFGVKFRSRCLRLPFGDQGLCLGRELFQRLGEFSETAAYGEDHLLVWAAHRQRVPLRSVGARIATSARKYQSEGWLRVTARHLWRTWRQAVPELLRFLWSRCR